MTENWDSREIIYTRRRTIPLQFESKAMRLVPFPQDLSTTGNRMRREARGRRGESLEVPSTVANNRNDL